MRAAMVGAASALAMVSALAAAPAQPAGADRPELNTILGRVAARVEEYFSRAQSIICQETVKIQSLESSMAPGAFLSRRVVSELRVEWQPSGDGAAPEATIQRDVLTINGKPPRPNDQDDCFDPKPVSPEPLAMFLAERQGDFVFEPAGTKRIDGRTAVVLDYKEREKPAKPKTTWRGPCVSIELPGWGRGRVWLDADTGDVLRLDASLKSRVDIPLPIDKQLFSSRTYMTVDRNDTSVHYKPVTFHDPDETVLLPDSIETFQMGNNRIHISQTYSNFRRFMTGGRVVKDR